jgi:membrane-bound ClpP family serine protease
MSERTWGMVVWLGIIGAIGSASATIAVYLVLKETTYALVFFIVTLLFAIMGAIANVGATQARRQRWGHEMAAYQQQVDDLFASAQAEGSAKQLGPEARAMADEATTEGEPLAGEEGERERVEHGNWE